MRLNTLLVLALLATASHAEPPDPRRPIAVDPASRALVLAEMRAFLEGVAGITEALAREDMEATARHAKALGMAMTGDVPPASMQQLPLEFRQMGMATHRAFDELALDAAQLGDPRHSLGQLGATLNRCVACHAMFRLEESR